MDSVDRKKLAALLVELEGKTVLASDLSEEQYRLLREADNILRTSPRTRYNDPLDLHELNEITRPTKRRGRMLG